eukprot:6060318-Pyramimonas_sp.AAC.1
MLLASVSNARALSRSSSGICCGALRAPAQSMSSFNSEFGSTAVLSTLLTSAPLSLGGAVEWPMSWASSKWRW